MDDTANEEAAAHEALVEQARAKADEDAAKIETALAEEARREAELARTGEEPISG